MTVEEIRKFCLSLPGTTEDVKWENHLCFNIGGKMYCVTVFENPITASIKVSDEDFKALPLRPGIIPAPYLARNMWVYIEEPGALKPQEWQHYLRESYRLILGKLSARLQKQLTGEATAAPQKAAPKKKPASKKAKPVKKKPAKKTKAATPKKKSAVKKNTSPKKKSAVKKATSKAKKR